MFNVEPFLNLSNCPNCSSPIKPNVKCTNCKAFTFFTKIPAIAFYSNHDSCIVSISQIIDYFDFEPSKSLDSSKSIKPIIQSTFSSPNPDISFIFSYINKLNTFQ